MHKKYVLITALLLLIGDASIIAQTKKKALPKTASPKSEMSFFVTSVGSGKGGDLGGLPGADRHCQMLAQAAGAKAQNWHAYLSTNAIAGAPAVNARDRIGSGPWYNAKGVLIARDIDELHSSNNINKDTALTERGEGVNGFSDSPNRQDMLTGSQIDGRVLHSDRDTTCSNWTNGSSGSAIVGHHDRQGLRDDDASHSWNASHATRGCSLEDLRATGGDGLFYCFAIR